MNNILEKLWSEYFCEDCSAINSEEEKAIAKILAQTRNEIENLPINEFRESIENYIAFMYKAQSLALKKAFFKGCEFAISFLVEVSSLTK